MGGDACDMDGDACEKEGDEWTMGAERVTGAECIGPGDPTDGDRTTGIGREDVTAEDPRLIGCGCACVIGWPPKPVTGRAIELLFAPAVGPMLREGMGPPRKGAPFCV